MAYMAIIPMSAASKAGKNYTPLSIAKEMGHTQIIELLEKAGAKE